MPKKTAGDAILEALAAEHRRVLSLWRATIFLRRASEQVEAKGRRWARSPRSPDDLKPVLAQMRNRGEIKPIAGLRDIYQVTVPYAGTSAIDAFEVLGQVNPFAAVSHLSAMEFHGLTDQLSKTIVASYPDSAGNLEAVPGITKQDIEIARQARDSELFRLIRGARPPAILGSAVSWRRTKPQWFFGVREYAPQGYPVLVTTPERTLLDGLLSPELSGGIENVLRAWSAARDTIDVDAVVHMVEQFQIGVLRQRVGFLLDELELRHAHVDAWRTQVRRGGSSKLVAAAPYGPTYDERWAIALNGPVGVLHE